MPPKNSNEELETLRAENKAIIAENNNILARLKALELTREESPKFLPHNFFSSHGPTPPTPNKFSGARKEDAATFITSLRRLFRMYAGVFDTDTKK